MDVCYNKLFKLLIDKGLKKTEFSRQVGISANTLANLSKNGTVSMDVLIRICRSLNCTIDDIVWWYSGRFSWSKYGKSVINNDLSVSVLFSLALLVIVCDLLIENINDRVIDEVVQIYEKDINRL